MKKSILFYSILAILFACGLLAACSKNYGTDYTQGPTTTIVHINTTGFLPDSVQLVGGTSVTWVNDDLQTHTVIADDNSFSSGNILPGKTFTYTFNSYGIYRYHCTIHPAETGVIISVTK